MSHPRKYYPHNTVLFITSSVEVDLPFIPCFLINCILEGLLARAQHKYGQEIVAFCMMGNHLHLIIRVTNPYMVSCFMKYFKSESAAAINILLGRKQHTVWCKGFDSPVVLTAKDVIDRIVYTYLNPVKARLVEKIDDYPGISSWKAFMTGHLSKEVHWIRRATLTKLANLEMNNSEQVELVNRLKKVNKTKHELVISPYAPTKVFKELKGKSNSEIKEEIVSKVRAGEENYKKENPHVMGSRRLRRQRINTPYESKREGLRSAVICSDIELRVRALVWYKTQVKLAKDAWKNGQFGGTMPLPFGFYGPGGVYTGELVFFMDWI